MQKNTASNHLTIPMMSEQLIEQLDQQIRLKINHGPDLADEAKRLQFAEIIGQRHLIDKLKSQLKRQKEEARHG